MCDLPKLSMVCRLLVLTAFVLAGALFTSGAGAQGIVVVVNGEPITTTDIDQRARLTQVSTQRTPPRKDVLQELIDERLKHQLLRRYMIPGIDKDVENAYNSLARRARLSPAQFTQQLAKAGVRAETLKSRIKAEIIWSQVIRGRFKSSLQIHEQDVAARVEAANIDEKYLVGWDYTLRPILFIVPRGSSAGVIESRRREAEALRSRFQDCRQGIALARTLRDVAVRPPAVRSSADLPPALRDILDKTEIGRLTSPEMTAQGVEVHALCDKQPSSAENVPARRKVREEMLSKQFELQADRFIKELRSQAMIEYR